MPRRSRAFSLVELIIVLVILGVITAIAIPRFTKGADGADATATQADLAVLRNAIELYKLDHGGTYPTLANFTAQMTGKSDADGTPNNATGLYGPYMVSVPKLKVGANKGNNTVAAPVTVPPVAEVAGAGWLYDAASGSVWANATGHFDK
ncbi:MAG: type II secretion system protein [Phycisphaerales bacterium]